ncbi:putative inactive dehydrogenase EasA [Leucoagaricus sp. SymC.cos]|nr:putative inactive dehydrogenase EasA [Leucoagaricus sp. SymC.cos]
MPSIQSPSNLFKPRTINAQIQVKHRVVLAPLTRIRATKDHVPTLPLMKDYYSQRASTPGTLIIGEATMIDPRAGGIIHAPGIYTKEHIAAWKEVVDSVHSKDSYMFCQLWACGAHNIEESDPPAPSSSGNSPGPMQSSGATIPEYIQIYAAAAHNAVHEAHFDGVEIHAANGFLIDQFIQDVKSERKNDGYGGSVERRSRFALEVVRAVVEAVGSAQKVGIRLSPWSPYNGMGMPDPIPQFSHLVSSIKQEFPDFGYIHIIEPRVAADEDYEAGIHRGRAANDFLRNIWSPKPYIASGGYNREEAIRRADERENELVAFGRRFIANPDLPVRLENDLPLNPYDRSTFYLTGDTTGRGYTDYPFYAAPTSV